MIELYSIQFRLWPIKTDFVLTTPATRKQSQIFPQDIAPETPLQHVCGFLFCLRKNNMFSQLFLFLHFVVKKDKQETREKQKRTAF